MSRKGSVSEGEARTFAQYDNDNPQIWRWFDKFALELVAAGKRNYSAIAVLYRVRWESAIRAKGDGFKISNNITPYYARKFHVKHPKLKGFFRTRLSAADDPNAVMS